MSSFTYLITSSANWVEYCRDSGQNDKINTCNKAQLRIKMNTASELITCSRFHVDLAGVGIVNKAKKLVCLVLIFNCNVLPISNI